MAARFQKFQEAKAEVGDPLQIIHGSYTESFLPHFIQTFRGSAQNQGERKYTLLLEKHWQGHRQGRMWNGGGSDAKSIIQMKASKSITVKDMALESERGSKLHYHLIAELI